MENSTHPLNVCFVFFQDLVGSLLGKENELLRSLVDLGARGVAVRTL